jgi:hypothetical protein
VVRVNRRKDLSRQHGSPPLADPCLSPNLLDEETIFPCFRGFLCGIQRHSRHRSRSRHYGVGKYQRFNGCGSFYLRASRHMLSVVCPFGASPRTRKVSPAHSLGTTLSAFAEAVKAYKALCY